MMFVEPKHRRRVAGIPSRLMVNISDNPSRRLAAAEGLAGTSLENAQAGTIRTRLLKIGALVRSSVRRVVFHLASGFPLQDVFRTAFARLKALPTSALAPG